MPNGIDNPQTEEYLRNLFGGSGSAGFGTTGGAGGTGGGFPWRSLAGIGGGALGTMLGGLFGGGDSSDAEKDASKYLQQIPGVMSKYMSPYTQAGQAAIPTLEQQYNQLLSDPGALMSKFGQSFQTSPGYQFSVDQATQAANRAAAAGGMVGSPAEQQQLGQTVTGLANQDYYNYIDRTLGLYGRGLQGWQGLETGGQQAATTSAQDMAEALMNQANLAYSSDINKQQQQQGFWGGLGGLLGTGLGIAGATLLRG